MLFDITELAEVRQFLYFLCHWTSGKRQVIRVLANSNGSGVIAILVPAITGGVTATASKMQLGQEEELVWHHAIRMSDGNALGAPVHRDTAAFINQAGTMVTAWGLKIMVWQERKQAVGISVAISKLDDVAVGFKALVIIILCGWFRNDPKENVIPHEVVLWLCVTSEAVDQNSEIGKTSSRLRLDQGVRLTAIDFFLQLEQNVFLVLEECVNNLLSIWSSGEAARKEGEATSINRHLTVHLNGFSVWQRMDLVHATHSLTLITNIYFLTAAKNLKKMHLLKNNFNLLQLKRKPSAGLRVLIGQNYFFITKVFTSYCKVLCYCFKFSIKKYHF